MYAPLRSLQAGLTTLKELDGLMVNIAKVTNLSAEAMDNLKNSAFEASNAFGRTAQDYLKSIGEFSRAGYEGKSADLAKISLLSQNVGELTAEQANSFLLATDAAYKYKGSQEELMKVLDGVNTIDNKFATSIQKVSEGITVAGSISSNASVGVNELASAVGVMTAVTQRSGNEAGRAFRSILMNIRQIKGETEDGEIIDDAALSKSAEALDNVGIKVHELRNGVEEIRNPMEVLKELSTIWGSLSSMKTAPIIDSLGGKFRGNQLVALVENFDMYEKMLSEYSTASGSAMTENEVRMGSWETKINQLRNAINNFWNNTIDTGFVKSMIGGITLLINNFGNLKTILGLIFTLLAVNKGTAFLTFLKNLSLSTMLLNSSLVQTQARLAGMSFAQIGVMGTTTALTFAIKGLWATMLANPIGLVVGAVTAVIVAFDFMGARAESSAKKQKEAFDELNRSISSLKQQTAESKNLANQYESLSAITSRNSNEEAKLAEVKDRLIAQFPDLIEGYDAEGRSIIGSSEAIKQAIKENEELLAIKQEQMSNTFVTDGSNNFSQLQKDQERLDLLTQHKKEYLKTIDDINNGNQVKFDEYGNDSLVIAKNNLKGIKDELSTLSTKILESRKDLSVLTDSFLKSGDSAQSLGKEVVTKLIYDLSKLKDESKITGEEFTKIFDGLKSSDFSSELSKAKTELEELAKSGASKDVIGNTYEKAISDLSPYLKALGINGEEAGKILKDMLNLPNATETSNKINTVTTSLKSLQKTLSDSSSAITEIQSALDEYAENKAFSLDTLVALGDKHESLIGILGDEKAVHQELTNIIEQEQEKARQAYITMLNDSEDFYNKNIEGIQKFVAGLDGAREVDLSGAKSLAEAKLKVENELMKNLAGMWSQYYDAQGNMTNANIIDGGRTIVGQDGKETYITPEMRSQLKAYYDASSAVKKKFDDIAMSGTKSIDFSKLGMSKSDNKKDKEKPQIESTTEALINQIQQEYLLQKAKSDSIQKDLSQAQSQKDYQKTLSLTNSLISSQAQELSLLNTARSKINQAKDSAISSASSQFGDVSERWFTGNDNQESVAYIEEHNKASEKTREIMDETFKSLQLLRNAWMSNKSAMDENAESQKVLQSSLPDINYSIVTDQISKFNSSIDSLNSQLDLSKARMSLLDDTSEEYRQELLNQTDAYQDLITKQQISIDYMKLQLLNENLSIESKANLTKQIEDATIAQLGYQKTIKDTAKQLATDVIEAQKALAQKELDAEEEILKAYIKRREEKIKGIQQEIEALEKKNEKEEESEERAKRLLDIEEKKQRLNNILAEKNTRILVGDQWTWQSNPNDVKSAQDDLKSAQEDYLDWEDDINLQHQKATLQAEIDYQQKLIDTKQASFDAQKLQFDEQWVNLDAMSTQLLEQYENNVDSVVAILSEKLVSLNAQLAEIVNASTSIPDSLSGGSNSGSSGSSGSSSSNENDFNVTKRGSYNPDTGNYSITDEDGNTHNGNGSLEDYENDFDRYHDGGWVGEKPKNLKLNEIPAILEKGEFVLSKEMISGLPNLMDITKNYMNNIKLPQMPNFTSNINNVNKSGSNGGNIIIQNQTIITPNVDNFKSQMSSLMRMTKTQDF